MSQNSSNDIIVFAGFWVYGFFFFFRFAIPAPHIKSPEPGLPFSGKVIAPIPAGGTVGDVVSHIVISFYTLFIRILSKKHSVFCYITYIGTLVANMDMNNKM